MYPCSIRRQDFARAQIRDALQFVLFVLVARKNETAIHCESDLAAALLLDFRCKGRPHSRAAVGELGLTIGFVDRRTWRREHTRGSPSRAPARLRALQDLGFNPQLREPPADAEAGNTRADDHDLHLLIL